MTGSSPESSTLIARVERVSVRRVFQEAPCASLAGRTMTLPRPGELSGWGSPQGVRAGTLDRSRRHHLLALRASSLRSTVEG